MSTEPWFIILVATTFIVAGVIKGMIGVGLPTVAIAALTAAIGLKDAIPIILIPSIVTNLWQGSTGGHFRYVLRRLWVFLLATSATVFLGVHLGARIDGSALQVFLGLSLVAYAVAGLANKIMSVPHERVSSIGAAMGCLNGLLTGLTGSFVFPGIPFIKAIKMPPAATIQALGIFMTMASFTLAIALFSQNRFPVELGLVSALAVLPAMLGMLIGQLLRGKLSDATFNRMFLLCMLFMGLYIIISAS